MNTEQALPNADQAGASEQVANIDTQAADTAANTEATDDAVESKEAKPERQPWEKELARERRRIANITRQKYELQAQLDALRTQVAPRQDQAHNQNSADDSEQLSLTRAQLEQMVREHATQLAPKIGQQEREQAETRERAIKLQKDLGERFEAVTDELSEVFPREHQLLVLRAKQPGALAEWLTDPDNAEDADRIARLSPVDAAWEMANISASLAAKPVKPARSSAPAPLESVRGNGGAITPKPLAALNDAEFDKRRREFIKSRRTR